MAHAVSAVMDVCFTMVPEKNGGGAVLKRGGCAVVV
jgi:hypothetical protein